MYEEITSTIKEILGILPEDAQEPITSIKGYLGTLKEVTSNDLVSLFDAITYLNKVYKEDLNIAKCLSKLQEALSSVGIHNYTFLEKVEQPKRLLFEAVLLEAEAPEEGTPKKGLRWKARLIKAGRSLNYRVYPEEVLKAAVSLFEGVKCYADHPDYFDMGRSVRDVVGWFEEAHWSDVSGSVDAILNVMESSAFHPFLLEMYERNRPDLIGLSIIGQGEGVLEQYGEEQLYVIKKIGKIESVDLVAEPAAGGGIAGLSESAAIAMYESVRKQGSISEEIIMDNEKIEERLVEPGPETVTTVQPVVDGVAAGSQHIPVITPKEGSDMGAVQEQLEKLAKRLDIEACARVLSEQLENSQLPAPVKTKIYKKYAGTTFEAKTLEDEITIEKDVYARVIEESRVAVNTWRSTNDFDRRQKALEGLLTGKMVDNIRPYRSLHESYLEFNGVNPFDLSRDEIAQGIMMALQANADPLTRIRESVTWSTAIGNTLHRMLVKEYQIPTLDEWRLVVSNTRNVADFKNQYVERLGFYDVLPTVAEGNPYTEPTSPSEEEASYVATKKGQLESYTFEKAVNDDIGALAQIPKKLAMAAKLTLYKTIFDVFDTNPTTTYDSTAWFDSTHSNKGSGTTLSAANVAAAITAMRTQTALSSSSMALSIRPKYMVVPPALEATAKQIRDGDFYYNASSVYVPNSVKGSFEIIVIDYWTTHTTWWFMVADPNLVPTIEVGFLNGKDTPELFFEAPNSGSGYTADKVYLKIRFIFGYAVADHRGVWGYLG